MKYFCLFIGPPRSGASILGGLLDAHPNIVIAHELNALRLLHLSRQELVDAITSNSAANAPTGRRRYCGYSSEVKDGFQGRYENLEVVGDKKADWTALHLLEKPELYQQLQDLVGVPIKFIHTIRHPMDNCSTILRKGRGYTLTTGEGQMSGGVLGFYFDKITAAVLQVRSQVSQENWLSVCHEDFIADPRFGLEKMCCFLGQSSSQEYLDKCCEVVRTAPNESRRNVNWSEEALAALEFRMREVDFLRRYV